MAFALRSFRSVPALALAVALAGCGSAAQERDGNSDGNRPAAAGAASPEAHLYVAQFTKRDPNSCFAEDVALQQPELQVASGGFGLEVPPSRVVVMIDGSGSMAGRIGGSTKLELARSAAAAFADALPSSVQSSLLVFGQQGDNSEAGKARSCSGLDVLSPMSRDRAPLHAALARIRAVGWTPLGAGLERAEALLAASSTPGDQVIYVVSDGVETCGADPVAIARRINGGRTRALVNIIGFDLPAGEAAALTAVARAGGGNFVNVSNRAELDRVAAEVRESVRRTRNDVNTSVARTRNDVATSVAVTRADVCVGKLISDEDVAMSVDLTRRDVRGQPVAFAAEARTLLKARHAALRARFEDYKARLTGAETAARRRIDAAADAAR